MLHLPKDLTFPLTVRVFSYKKHRSTIRCMILKKNLKILLCHAVVVLKRYEILFAHQNRDPFEKEFIGEREKKKLEQKVPISRMRLWNYWYSSSYSKGIVNLESTLLIFDGSNDPIRGSLIYCVYCISSFFCFNVSLC